MLTFVNSRVPCAISILLYLILFLVPSLSPVNCDIAKKIGLGNWWGPSGVIRVIRLEADRNNTDTVYTIPIEPWWTEGTFPSLGVQGFVIPANPANACTIVEGPPEDNSFDLVGFPNKFETTTFFLLTGKDTDCDFGTKVKNANNSGYSGIIITNTGSDVPEPAQYSFPDYSIYACSIGDEDGFLLRSNFSYPVYSITVEDKRSTFLHNIIEIVILTLAVILGLIVLILIWNSIAWCSMRIKDCLSLRRVERRATLLNSTISSLPIRKWARELDTLSEANKVCRICREHFQDDEEIRILPCRHIFHLICVDQWILEDRTYCITCKHILLPPDEHFLPSDVSDSGEFAVVISSETLPLMDPEGYVINIDDKNPDPQRQSRLQAVHSPETFFDASFESVLHAPANWNLRKTGESFQKKAAPDVERVADNHKPSQSLDARSDVIRQMPTVLNVVREETDYD